MEISSAVLQRTRKRTLAFLNYKFNGTHRDIYEDAVQKAFTDLYEKQLSHAFEVEAQLCRWLATAAWWYVLKELKYNARRVVIDEYMSSNVEDEAIAHFENSELLYKLRSSLPRKKAE